MAAGVVCALVFRTWVCLLLCVALFSKQINDDDHDYDDALAVP